MISLSERWTDWRFMLAFVLPAAEQRVQALQFVQIEREPNGDDAVRLCQTKTSFMMGPEMAQRVCRAFVDAALLSRYPSPGPEEVFAPTPKGLHLIDKFVTRHGIATDSVTKLLNMQPVCDKLVMLERDDQDDVLLSDAVVHVVFQRMVGTSPHRDKDSSLGMALEPVQMYDVQGTPFESTRFEAGHALHWLVHFTTLVSADEAAVIAAHMVRIGWIEADGTFSPGRSTRVATVCVDSSVRMNGTASEGTFIDGEFYHVTPKGASVAWSNGAARSSEDSARSAAQPTSDSRRRAAEAPFAPRDMRMNKAARIAWKRDEDDPADKSAGSAPATPRSKRESVPRVATPEAAMPRAAPASPMATPPRRTTPSPRPPVSGASLSPHSPLLSRSGSTASPARRGQATFVSRVESPRMSAGASPAPSASPAARSAEAPPASPAARAAEMPPGSAGPSAFAAPTPVPPAPSNNIQKLAKILHHKPLRLRFRDFLQKHSTDQGLRFWCEVERFRGHCRQASSGALVGGEAADAIESPAPETAKENALQGGDAPRRRAAQRPQLIKSALRLQPYIAADTAKALGMDERVAAELRNATEQYSQLPPTFARSTPLGAAGNASPAAGSLPSAEEARENEVQLAKLLVLCARAQSQVYAALAEEPLVRFLAQPAELRM